ncbi:MAG: TetR/AcrR family transcriptional regulator [Actinomycetota bacterium]|nr:TetR/AcrR family transcriptional regulator [Actinomycetota bacterium]
MSSAERREQLLDVTASLVAEGGFAAVTIQSVARAAGISRPIVYEHYGDLTGLLGALVARELARARAQVWESTLTDLDTGDPIELMVASLRTYLTAVQRHPDTWRLVLMPPEGAPEALRRRVQRGRGAILAKLADAVRPGLTPGRATPDPELTAWTLSAIADEYARLILTDPQRYPVERLLAQARWFLSDGTGWAASPSDSSARR